MLSLFYAYTNGSCLHAQTPPATIQYDQPGYNTFVGTERFGTGGYLFSHVTDGDGHRAYDDFTLPIDTLFTGFQWLAVSVDTRAHENNPSTPNIATWEISIWTDDGGKPGERLFSETKAAADVPTRELPLVHLQAGRFQAPLFQYTFATTEPVLLKSGQRYWISPVAESPDKHPQMAWAHGIGEGDPSRELSILANNSGESWSTGRSFWSSNGLEDGNRAMVLLGRPANDGDADGIDDAWEAAHGLDPERNDALNDPDMDGATNLEEFERRSDPQDPDSDGDGLPDGVETNRHRYVDATDTGTDPRKPDSDGDGVRDNLEQPTAEGTGSDPNYADTDGDGYHDGLETAQGTNPSDPTSFFGPVILDSLLGHDTTDPEDDGVADALTNYDAVFEAGFETITDGKVWNPGFKIFDNRLGSITDDRWKSRTWPTWVQATLKEPIVLTHFTLTSGSGAREQDTYGWEIQGSNDGGQTFTTIFRRWDWDHSVWTDSSQVLRFDAGAHYSLPAPYSTFRLTTWDLGSDQFRVSELELFGQPYEFKINRIQRIDTTTAQMEWASLPNSSYVLEHSSDLLNWTQVMSDIQTAGPISRANVDTSMHPLGYFRVREDLPLQADFEKGSDGWTTETNLDDTPWELGRSTIPPTRGTNNQVYGTKLDGDYAPGTKATLRSPLVDLTESNHAAVLSFQYFIETPGDSEGGQLRFVDDAGELIMVHETPFTGTSNAWETFKLTLPEPLQNRAFKVEFALLSNDDDEVGAGWYIDDVVIR